MEDKKFRRRLFLWWLQFFLWWKLPAAAFIGVRLEHLDDERCVICLPYRWRSRNPFRSIYFAAQCVAAELSTGLPAWMAVREQSVPVSMLVIHLEASFIKKAAQPVWFTCESLREINQVVRHAAESDAAQTLRVLSIGRLLDGTEVTHVWITWSFRRRRQTVFSLTKDKH
ncbi:MAG: DUF4442 domain-containing protein [Saprospiraceae bacterium]|nr:DUF4442 domain-containing protein [Saprospiraceae bacterium]MDW8483515.1 DUF4442 domain-containing protein [Saprospiraceae bacterium]